MQPKNSKRWFGQIDSQTKNLSPNNNVHSEYSRFQVRDYRKKEVQRLESLQQWIGSGLGVVSYWCTVNEVLLQLFLPNPPFTHIISSRWFPFLYCLQTVTTRYCVVVRSHSCLQTFTQYVCRTGFFLSQKSAPTFRWERTEDSEILPRRGLHSLSVTGMLSDHV